MANIPTAWLSTQKHSDFPSDFIYAFLIIQRTKNEHFRRHKLIFVMMMQCALFEKKNWIFKYLVELYVSKG
jgi:hypothetical protein